MKNELDIHNNEQLKGRISLKLQVDKSLEEFCEKKFENYNRDQFEAVAIKFHYGDEVLVTLYALDKVRQEGTTFNPKKLPIKKFKSTSFELYDILLFVKEFNVTLTTGNYRIQDMEVINK
ncbi:MAG: hypothetical protein JWP12_3525 [Bacteroidetes bacterium]|nr:hypothetical protein [Bacteroidota bacterium]